MTTRQQPTQAINADAREFGLHMKQGGWRLGLLVARNVAVAPGRVAPETLLPKVNATEFARRAGTSNDRVLRHLAAWERAAGAGLVPHAADLNPGTELELDVERLPAWSPIYNAPAVPRTRPAQRTTTPVAPVRTRPVDPPTPPVQAPTVEPDAHDAQVSRQLEAAAERAREHLAALRDDDAVVSDNDRAAARNREWTEDVRYAVNAMIGHTRRIFDAARDDEWADTNARTQAARDLRGIARQLDMIADMTTSPDHGQVTDEALASLLNG